jgi:hypothetical protein
VVSAGELERHLFLCKAEHNMRAGEAEGSLKTMREQEDTLNTHLIDVQGMSYLDPHLLQRVMPAIIFGPV